MSDGVWPKAEIKKVAAKSGKPLEVTCAQAFLAAGWKARLGSYFAEGALDVVRELDVVAEKSAKTQNGSEVRLRAVVSCRGFPPERAPMLYSLSTSSVPSFEPRVLSGHRTQNQLLLPSQNHGPLENFEKAAAERLLSCVDLQGKRPIVAYDLIERIEKKEKGQPTVSFSRARDGDKQIFSAVDSAVKAGLFWMQEDYQQAAPQYFASLTVPICVLAEPFWDVCIDPGTTLDPELRNRAYQINAYPVRPASKSIMIMVFSAAHVPDLIKCLDSLFHWFLGDVTKAGL